MRGTLRIAFGLTLLGGGALLVVRKQLRSRPPPREPIDHIRAAEPGPSRQRALAAQTDTTRVSECEREAQRERERLRADAARDEAALRAARRAAVAVAADVRHADERMANLRDDATSATDDEHVAHVHDDETSLADERAVAVERAVPETPAAESRHSAEAADSASKPIELEQSALEQLSAIHSPVEQPVDADDTETVLERPTRTELHTVSMSTSERRTETFNRILNGRWRS